MHVSVLGMGVSMGPVGLPWGMGTDKDHVCMTEVFIPYAHLPVAVDKTQCPLGTN